MAYCVSSPTLTSTGVGTTRSVSTTISRFVTTPPGSVFTSVFATCSTSTNSTICATTSRVVTQPGTPFTTTGQVVVTVDVPYTYRTTLYGSSCTTSPGAVVTPTIYSPVVSTVTSSSVYTSDGSTYVTVVTSLTSADLPQSTTDTPPSPSSNSSGSTDKKIPAIVGGALGALIVLALLTFVVIKFLKKPRISFDKEDFTPTKQDQASYHYTPVGQQETQPVAQTFNDSGPQPANYGNDTGTFSNGVAGGDTLTQYTGATNNAVGPTTTGNETGLQPGIPGNDVMYNAPNHGPIHQVPNSSLTPLVAGAAAVTVAGAAARPTSTYSSTGYPDYPPNMGYSSQQYPPQSTVLAPYPQQEPYQQQPYPQQPYPQQPYPQQQPYSQQQHYPEQQPYSEQQPYPQHQPYPQQQPYPQPYGPPPMQNQTQRSLSHHLSVGSTMSMSTSGGIGGSSGPSMDAMPSLVIQPGQIYPQHQQPFVQQSYGESLSGSQSVGSAGPPETQVLQIRNPGPDTIAQDSSAGLVAPPPSTSSPSPIDGKGRPLDMGGEKAAMVHLDGGAYGESSTPAPPAYME